MFNRVSLHKGQSVHVGGGATAIVSDTAEGFSVIIVDEAGREYFAEYEGEATRDEALIAAAERLNFISIEGKVRRMVDLTSVSDFGQIRRIDYVVVGIDGYDSQTFELRFV